MAEHEITQTAPEIPAALREQLRRVARRVVKLQAFGMADEVIANVVQLPMQAYQNLLRTPEYLEEFAQAEEAWLAKASTLNESWDSVEATAINHVLQALNTAGDPDYALRAAAVANKAARRNSRHGAAVNSHNDMRAVITLNQAFVTTNDGHAQLPAPRKVAYSHEKGRTNSNMPGIDRIYKLLGNGHDAPTSSFDGNQHLSSSLDALDFEMAAAG